MSGELTRADIEQIIAGERANAERLERLKTALLEGDRDTEFALIREICGLEEGGNGNSS